MRTLRLAVAFAVPIACALCATSGLAGEGLLVLAPALLLLVTLSARRYPGERLLRRLAGARPGNRRLRSAVLRASLAGRVVRMPHGGLLMGFALAVRPPPLLPAAAS